MSASSSQVELIRLNKPRSELALFDQSRNPAVMELNDAIAKLAPGRGVVLILGEPGLCKGLIARKIHQLSSRASEEFLEHDAAHIVPEWFDEMAASHLSPRLGTVLLVEIADLSLPSQKKLLEQWLDESFFTHQRPRLIMSSSRNLELESRSGAMDEHFYSRISTVSLRVPALRHRPEDVEPLVDFYLAKYSALFGIEKPVIPESMMQLLRDHLWPGNIRELEEAIKTIAAIGDERIANMALRARLAGGSGATHSSVSLKRLSKAASWKAEREVILTALDRSRWNRRRAAENLGISYKALLYKLKQIGSEEQNVSSDGEV